MNFRTQKMTSWFVPYEYCLFFRHQTAIIYSIKEGKLPTVYIVGTKQTYTPQSKPYHIGSTIKRPRNEKIPLRKRSYSGIKQTLCLEKP